MFHGGDAVTYSIQHCRFINNRGGMGAVLLDGQSSFSSIASSYFGNNLAGTGVIVASEGSGYTIENCNFELNTATQGGGVVYLMTMSGVQVQDCQFATNEVQDGSGGALYVAEGTDVSVVSCKFTENVASFGGGNK